MPYDGFIVYGSQLVTICLFTSRAHSAFSQVVLTHSASSLVALTHYTSSPVVAPTHSASSLVALSNVVSYRIVLPFLLSPALLTFITTICFPCSYIFADLWRPDSDARLARRVGADCMVQTGTVLYHIHVHITCTYHHIHTYTVWHYCTAYHRFWQGLAQAHVQSQHHHS